MVDLQEKKKILVVGATGHQGAALIAALSDSHPHISPPTAEPASQSVEQPSKSASEPLEFRVLALTRDAKSSKAQGLLASYPHVNVVQGNLDHPQTVRAIFEDSKASGDLIWGVFCALQFPGLGANADGEEAQGKLIADLCLEYGVSTFILSTSERGGEKDDADNTNKLHDRIAKVKIERHTRALGERGLNWTILRPGFFMENYEGMIGSITVGVLKAGLKPDTAISMVAAADIGRVAAGVFKNPDNFKNKILVVVGERSTLAEQEAAYKRATEGKNTLPAVSSLVAKSLIQLNKHTRILIDDLERVHRLISGEFRQEFETQVALSREACPDLQGFESWARELKSRSKAGRKDNWNGVSMWKLITGKQ